MGRFDLPELQPPGRYRFVVTAHDCFQPHTTYGDPFTLGAR